jgi:hypothetical protein
VPDAPEARHIPGAISQPFVVPFSAWITMRDDLLLEVPDAAELFQTIGSMGNQQDFLETATPIAIAMRRPRRVSAMFPGSTVLSLNDHSNTPPPCSIESN